MSAKGVRTALGVLLVGLAQACSFESEAQRHAEVRFRMDMTGNVRNEQGGERHLMLDGDQTRERGYTLSAAPRTHFSGTTMNREIARRFPGVTFLSEAEFASSIVGNRFRYREVGSELTIERPAEGFFESGRYSVGHRVISQGTYSFDRGVVSIDCIDCPATFLGLGRKRVFFRHEGRLLMANANGNEIVIELIRKS